LKAIVFDERSLQRMKLAVFDSPFNRRDFPAFVLSGKGQTRIAACTTWDVLAGTGGLVAFSGVRGIERINKTR
jgi:hypothetical protein